MNSSGQDDPQEPSDGEYVVSSRNGCPDHFRLLVQRYQRPLYAYLSSRLRNHLEAEEAAQESFVRAFMSLKKLRKPESFYAWLLGIASRVLKEQFRAQERRQQDCAIAETLLAEIPGTTPEYPLEEAIAVLPESYRQVILLRYYEGLSCQEIATRLGMPLGTVTKTLSRAYALLRQALKARESAEATAK
jgi:RNA polymerase sigma-70 factor, ECF subfamily